MTKPHPNLWALPDDWMFKCEDRDSGNCSGRADWFLDGYILSAGGGSISGRFFLCDACARSWLS